MKTFGITIRRIKGVDVRDIVARLFLCPMISPEQAMIMIDNLIKGSLPVAKLITTTDKYIVLMKEKDIDEFQRIMANKLDAWTRKIGPLSVADYTYIEDTYGYSLRELGSVCTKSSQSLMSPIELASHVKRFIKGQDIAISQLAVPFFLHLHSKVHNYTSKVKTPTLLMGGTGVGKSEIFRRFAEVCDCPVIRVNTSELTPTGWKGLHLTDILLRELNNGVSKRDLEYCIIIFHEFDKLTHHGVDRVSDNGSDHDMDMYREIMRLVETNYSITITEGVSDEIKYRLPVDNLMLVFDGAFVGMEEIVKKRLHIHGTVGFGGSNKESVVETNYLDMVNTQDLLSWGFPPELLGRIGEKIVLNPLSIDVIVDIMKNAEDNILKSHIDVCARNNIDLRFEDGAIKVIAEEAQKIGLGFRSVKTLLSRALNKLYFEIPNSVGRKKMVVKITKEYVENVLRLNEK